MSNDKTTLADVRPGGRVRLGDQALSTAELRRNAHVLVLQEMRTRFTDAGSPSRTAALDAAISALSAQPFPSDQTDAWAIKTARESAFAHSNEHAYLPQTREETNSWQPHDWVVAAIQTALLGAPPAQRPAQVYLDGLDRALGEAIEQRDRYHEVADDLAAHIARITGVDIGEHSSANCPWQNAIEAAEEYKPAQAVDLERARDEGHDGAIRYVLGYLNGTGDCGSTAYDEILNACGRERIIRSAVEDGELEFTGLGRWVEMYGTAEDRALIDGKEVGNG